MQLIHKDILFIWNLAYSNIFYQLKETFVKASIFMKFNRNKQIIVECDASNNVIGGVFFQFDSTSTL